MHKIDLHISHIYSFDEQTSGLEWFPWACKLFANTFRIQWPHHSAMWYSNNLHKWTWRHYIKLQLDMTDPSVFFFSIQIYSQQTCITIATPPFKHHTHYNFFTKTQVWFCWLIGQAYNQVPKGERTLLQCK